MFLKQLKIDNETFKAGGLDNLVEALPDAPPPLLNLLYGSGSPAGVYMLVDASLRRQISGLFVLDSIELPALCLFEGKAAEESADFAPWLIDMSIPEPARAAGLAFHRKFFSQHWPAGTSLLIQTDAPFVAVQKHLRRFIKLPVQDDGGLRFFRFWDPRVLHPFLNAIAGDASRMRRMMMTDSGVPLHYVLRHDETDIRLSPDAGKLADTPITAMHLRFADFDPIARERAAERLKRIIDRIQADFARELEHRPRKAIEAAVEHAMQRFGAYGFREHAHLHFFAVWTVFYEPDFERRDPAGKLEEICRSSAPETEKFKAFRDRFDRFSLKAA
ncbi:DUF4123 domain-containing protein [Paracoccus alkanivorans]|uniref:DUF4123 domain-containing protein n=1 Tax=Paracoccus alkanivorans TaxID=2116655 RepID=A0A3M0LXN2_9RHOB|nr:DUF4123 domain-containing protein [Paracoccus alkanivorans]RMC30116.1 DUF4123 domain-containing protein [Paracoccus alkanivorans]